MAYVYILESEKNGRYYIGIADDVQSRLDRHNKGLVPATHKHRPYQLRLVQEFKSKLEARQVELKLKKLKRRDYITKTIQSQCIRFRDFGSSGSDTSVSAF